MVHEDDLQPCGVCGTLFGRHTVGFRGTFDHGVVIENWMTSTLVCTLCKRDPRQHQQWRTIYLQYKPWMKAQEFAGTKKELRPKAPNKLDIVFIDQLVPDTKV